MGRYAFFINKLKCLSQENEYYWEAKNMTREEAVRRIERAAKKKLTKLDLSYLKKASCESEKLDFPA